jgi:PAS domain S-box-containing protein
MRAGARLRAVLEHSPSSIFMKDMSGRYLYVNAEWCRLSGIDAAQAVGRTTADCWPRNAGSIAENERRLAELDGPLIHDEQLITPDGTRDFIVERFYLRDADGRPTALCGIATEITERKQMELELARRDLLLQAVLRASPDIITIVDRDGRPHQVSDSEVRIFGDSYRDLDPPEQYAIVHENDRERVKEAFSRLADASLGRMNIRYRVRHKDGHYLIVDSRAQAMFDDNGDFAGAVVVTRDVTEKTAAERTLNAAREAAERASAAKTEFLSRMSHELRTPLNSVLGFAQLLKMDELPGDQMDATEHILAAGRHLLDLIDEVLDIARIESGHLELAMVPVPVARIVTEAVELTRPLARRSGISIEVDLEAVEGRKVYADRQRLLQVLLNLLSNAVKYNRPNGSVRVVCSEVGASRLRFEVTDSGRGILPGDHDRVFEPFDRLGAEVDGPDGTGVGLSLSRQLVEHMGGVIDFESEPRVGSTFFVDLDAAATPEQNAFQAQRTSGDSDAFKVLLVEDDLSSLDLVERVLERRCGVKMLAAMHGGLAVELAREHRPDLILLDVSLPDLSPASAISRLSMDPVTRVIPVAALTADASARQLRELLDLGVAGILTKPLDIQGLLSLVDQVLGDAA